MTCAGPNDRVERRTINSMEGSGSALGAVTGKVLASKVMKKDCDLCKKGLCDGGARCNKNYAGSSGGMESQAGSELILELADLAQDVEGNGIRLERYLTDLDANTAATIRKKNDESNCTLPEQKYDPGHWTAIGRKVLGRI